MIIGSSEWCIGSLKNLKVKDSLCNLKAFSYRIRLRKKNLFWILIGIFIFQSVGQVCFCFLRRKPHSYDYILKCLRRALTDQQTVPCVWAETPRLHWLSSSAAPSPCGGPSAWDAPRTPLHSRTGQLLPHVLAEGARKENRAPCSPLSKTKASNLRVLNYSRLALKRRNFTLICSASWSNLCAPKWAAQLAKTHARLRLLDVLVHDMHACLSMILVYAASLIF